MSDKASPVYFAIGYKPEQRQFVYLAFGPEKEYVTTNAHERGVEYDIAADRILVVELDTTKEPAALQAKLLTWLAEQDIIGAEAKAASREIWLKLLEVITSAYRHIRRT